MNVHQFSPAHQYAPHRRLGVEPVGVGDPPRFDWLLLSFWVSYFAVYVATAWTVLRWATLPVVGA